MRSFFSGMKVIGLLACVLVIGVGLGPASAQITTADNEYFETVPRAQRQDLISRLNAFIGYEQKGEYKASFGMIAQEFKDSVQGGLSFEQYREESKIRSFKVTGLMPVNSASVYSVPPIASKSDAFFVNGCGVFKNVGKKQGTLIEAYLESGLWMFSPMQFLGMETATPCLKNSK